MWNTIAEKTTELEAIWNETGPMLWEFMQREGYVAMGYKSMGGFLRAQKQCSQTHVSRMLEYARAQNIVTGHMIEHHPEVNIIDSERSYRPVSRLEDDQIAVVMDRAVELAEEENDENVLVKPKHIRNAKIEFRAQQEAAKTAGVDPVDMCLHREQEFASIMHEITSLRMRIKELAADSSVNIFFRNPQRVDLDLHNVFEALKFAAPYKRCPYCHGNGARCTGCRSAGWVNKQIWQTSPEGKKERADKLAEQRAAKLRQQQAEVQLADDTEAIPEHLQRENVRIAAAQ